MTWRTARRKVNGSHLLWFSSKYFQIEAISGVILKSRNRHHKCYVNVKPPSASFLQIHALWRSFFCHEGWIMPAQAVTSGAHRGEGAEGCYPGHRKGRKQWESLWSVIKKHDMPGACLPSCLHCESKLLSSSAYSPHSFQLVYTKSTWWYPGPHWRCG